MRIALLQYSPDWENKRKNREKINSMLQKSRKDFSLLILPELTLTGFTMQVEKFAENTNSETFHFYAGLAEQYNVHIAGGLIENNESGFYNSLIHITPEGKQAALYRKIHPFSFAKEDKFYVAGKNPVITQIDDWKTGLSICYDLRFPELYRKYGKEKSELIIVIANWPDKRIEHWRTLLKARAIENQVYVAGVNRCGDDPFNHYNGYSSVFDPMGKELISIVDEETIELVEISKEMINETRERLPFLNDIKLI